jgi:mannitol/fructose-specific phosphotransferase system IIA component (Ntr-type)
MLEKYISRERVVFFDAEQHKQQALAKLMDATTASKSIIDAVKFRNGILERENILSTGLGRGIAVPHTYSDAIKDIVVAVGVSGTGISDYGSSMDDKPVHFIIMVAAGSHQHTEYLQILAQISLLGKDEKARNALLAAKTADEVIAALSNLHS